MQKITPFLWFDNQAEEAANFYVSIFKNSKIDTISRYGDAGPGLKGTVMVVTFQLEGQKFAALNGGPVFTFTPAISLFVDCETQEEVDELWDKLLVGGRKDRCGWLQDKYGLSWQIIPTVLSKLMSDPDTAKSSRVMKAMLQMDKIDIKRLQEAYQLRSGCTCSDPNMADETPTLSQQRRRDGHPGCCLFCEAVEEKTQAVVDFAARRSTLQ